MDIFKKTVKRYSPILVLILLIILLLIPSNNSYLVYPYAQGNGDQQIINLSTNTSTTNMTINGTTTLTVEMNTQGDDVNAVGIVIQYNSNLLQEENVDTTSSFCTLYTDRAINTTLGTINLYCGTPSPGFNGQNVLENITFQAIGYGSGSISVAPQSIVLLNNGKGTNILHDFEKIPVSVILSE